jgi:lipoate-protein ligase A
MQFLDLTLPTVAENLALDEALLLEAEASRGKEVLRLWEWPAPAVILGAGCRLTEDVNEAMCRARQVPVLRRSSGGGTVLLGRGCLLYSLVLAYSRSVALNEVRSSYSYILDALCAALDGILPGLHPAGVSDLAAGEWKVSGNAQQRKRHWLLHHGTLLYDFDLDAIGHYLRVPVRQPDYRRGRDHVEFVRNLPIQAADLKGRLRQTWHAAAELSAWPEQIVKELAAGKYTSPEWTARR